jgi:hypothetical protein
LVEKKLNLPEVDFTHLKEGAGGPPLGRYPKHRVMGNANANVTEAKKTKRKRRRGKKMQK